MKQFYTLLILAFFSFSMLAQANLDKNGKFRDYKTNKNTKNKSNTSKKNKAKFSKVNSPIKQLDSIMEYDWDVNTGKFILSGKTEFLYNTEGNSIIYSEISHEWNPTAKNWNRRYKYEETNDELGNLIYQSSWEWDMVNSQWINDGSDRKDENIYDVNNKLTQVISLDWDGVTNQFVNYYKYNYTLNVSGNQESRLEYYWDKTNDNWELNSKREYVYDSNENLIKEINYTWKSGENLWVESYKTEFFYDSSGHLITEVYHIEWDSNINTWKYNNAVKYEHTYDSSGNGILESGFLWNENQSKWIETDKYTHTFDLNYNHTDLITPWSWFIDVTFNINNMLTNELGQDFDENSQLYVNSWYYTYRYSDISLSVKQDALVKMAIYPNPADDFLNINSETPINKIEIYSILGKRVLETKDTSKINVSNLESGFFLLKLYSGNIISVKKIIIE